MRHPLLIAFGLIASFFLGYFFNYFINDNKMQKIENIELRNNIEIQKLNEELVTCKLNYKAVADELLGEGNHQIK